MPPQLMPAAAIRLVSMCAYVPLPALLTAHVMPLVICCAVVPPPLLGVPETMAMTPQEAISTRKFWLSVSFYLISTGFSPFLPNL